MDRVRGPLAAWWRSAPGTVIIYGALLTHFALALVSLYRRTTLRMPFWEAAQLTLSGLALVSLSGRTPLRVPLGGPTQLPWGLLTPPLLIGHVIGTRFAW